MSTSITAAEIIEQAESHSGVNFGADKTRPLKELNRTLRWAWEAMASGFEGFASKDTKIDSPASGTTMSILAGQGGADGSVPIVRGVFQLRGVYRAVGAAQLSGDRYPANWMLDTTYYDRFGDRDDTTVNTVGRPGIYWFNQAEDGTADDLHVRPGFNGVERLRLKYQPTAIQVTALSDTLEALNDAENVLAHHMGYRLANTKNHQLANQLLILSDKLLDDKIKGYNGKRSSTGPDSTDHYYRRSSRGSGG